MTKNSPSLLAEIRGIDTSLWISWLKISWISTILQRQENQMSIFGQLVRRERVHKPFADFEGMTIRELSAEIGVRFRAERIRLGLTQAEMAARAQLTVRTYRRLETAGAGSIRVLLAVLKACNRLRALQVSLPQRDLPKVRNALSIVEQSPRRRKF